MWLEIYEHARKGIIHNSSPNQTTECRLHETKTRNRQRWCFITEMFVKNFAIVFTLALLNGSYSGCMSFIHLVNNGTILFIDNVHRHVPGKTRLLKIKKIIELLIYFLCNRQRSALYWLLTCMLTRNFIIDLFDGRCDS